ncbi:MAG TPA: TonB-dependent receptor [Parapedobacter sp.]|uniref:SusC/RagA family TonB-linked outer membrane protein n=1 Tax=Parapedobacter sp. TaxID=1958893 RepID=UPI002C5CD705|nr:TonB-dependent receptor [Parapedobacter sp.]HWK57641.1 TonB-dependent receptor [Parapedobacter sp.]
MKFFTLLILTPLLNTSQLSASSINTPLGSDKVASSHWAQVTVKGNVSDDQGVLSGVSIKVKETASATVSDQNGNYEINAPANATLAFSFLGYIQQEVAVNDQSVINVILVPDLRQLEDVVVTGYRTQSRGSITGSVSSVNSSDFKDTPVDNLSNALSGRLSGVTITQAAGTPGMESSIRVRAQGTFNNADPLYVIDGIVSDKFAFDGLGPTEVESITVLKDGASAAIYGSRAANGVILVTTKRGKEGTPQLSYNGLAGVQTPTKLPETLNAYEHASQINHQLKYTNVPITDARYYTQDELDYFKTNSWNWVEEMWKDPITTQHSLDVSGGTSTVRYFLGGSYNYATGTFDNVGYKKLNLRGNVDVSITKDLKVSLDLNTDKRNTNGPSWDINNWRLEDLYKALLLRSSMVPPYINGLPVGNWVEWHPGVVLDRSSAGYNDREWNGLNYTVALNYKVPFIEGLSAKVSYNKYNRNRYIKQFNLPYNMTLFNTLGEHNHIVGDQVVGTRPRAAAEFLQSRYDKGDRYQLNAQLNFTRTFNKHHVDALLVYEQAEENDLYFSGRRDDFISAKIDQYVGGSNVNSTVDGSESELARLSYVGLVGYNYAQKYLLEASFRYDGSVIFAPEKRWGFFPSVSAGWRISEESFFNGNGFVNDLKLRASVGMLGNDAVGNFQWLQSYNIVPGAIFDQASFGLEQGVLANRAITWEKSLSYNGGIDAQFLDNKFNIKIDGFFRHTYDILGSRQLSIPSTLGATLPDENYQEIDSRGFEIELGYANQAGNSDKSIAYFVRGNFGYATNKVVKLDEAENIRPYLSKIGRPVNGILGYVASGILRTQADLDALPEGYTILGVAPQLGMLNYKDLRGPNSDSPDGRITSDDRMYISDYRIPPMNFGLSFGASFGAFSVDVLLQGVAGGNAMLPTSGRDIQARAEEASFAYWADSWSPENPNGEYPGYRVTGYRTRFDESTFWLMDLTFLRFKNMNISYSLPQGILRGINVKSTRIFFTGSNLFMLYSGNKIYDAEMNNIQSYPMMATYSFGLNIGL